MSNTARNKQTVMKLFDALRAADADAFDNLIAVDYVQHNPLAGNGLQAVKAFFTQLGPGEIDVHRIIADGDFVVAHSYFKPFNSAAIDIWRFNDEGKMIEHWDAIQQVPETTASGNDMFTQLT